MGKHYDCDYCDKRFKDTKDVRRNHLQGLKHKVAKANFYASQRDLRQLVREEREKGPCMRYFKSGDCMFENFCRFSHHSPAELRCFEETVQSMPIAFKKPTTPADAGMDSENKLAVFLANRNDRLLLEQTELKCFWTFPAAEQSNLPPSLQRLDLKQIPDSYNSWGE